MTRNELYNAAGRLADCAINNCPDDLWEQLEAHAEANWSCSAASMIILALEHGFGVGHD